MITRFWINLLKSKNPIISAKRCRRKFRALSDAGCLVHFQFTREEVDHVPDGTHTETYTDKDDIHTLELSRTTLMSTLDNIYLWCGDRVKLPR